MWKFPPDALWVPLYVALLGVQLGVIIGVTGLVLLYLFGAL